MAEVSTEPEEMARKAEEEELDPRVKVGRVRGGLGIRILESV